MHIVQLISAFGISRVMSKTCAMADEQDERVWLLDDCKCALALRHIWI